MKQLLLLLTLSLSCYAQEDVTDSVALTYLEDLKTYCDKIADDRKRNSNETMIVAEDQEIISKGDDILGLESNKTIHLSSQDEKNLNDLLDAKQLEINKIIIPKTLTVGHWNVSGNDGFVFTWTFFKSGSFYDNTLGQPRNGSWVITSKGIRITLPSHDPHCQPWIVEFFFPNEDQFMNLQLSITGTRVIPHDEPKDAGKAGKRAGH